MKLSKVISLFEDNDELNELITAISYNGDVDSFKLTLEYWDKDFEKLYTMDADLNEDGSIGYIFKIDDNTDNYYLPDQFAYAITSITQIWNSYMSISEETFDTALEYLNKMCNFSED